MNSKVKVNKKGNKIIVNPTHSLDKNSYNEPLTLKTYVASGWKNVLVKQEGKEQKVSPEKDEKGSYILCQAFPDTGSIVISGS